MIRDPGLIQGILPTFSYDVGEPPIEWMTASDEEKACSTIVFLSGISETAVHKHVYEVNRVRCLNEENFDQLNFSQGNAESLIENIADNVRLRIPRPTYSFERIDNTVSCPIPQRFRDEYPNIQSFREEYSNLRSIIIPDASTKSLGGTCLINSPSIRDFLFRWWNKGFCSVREGSMSVINYFQMEYMVRSAEKHVNADEETISKVRREGDSSRISETEFSSFTPEIQRYIFYLFYMSIKETFGYYIRWETFEFPKLSSKITARYYLEEWFREALTIAGRYFIDRSEKKHCLNAIGEMFQSFGMNEDLGVKVYLYRAMYESLDNVLIPLLMQRTGANELIFFNNETSATYFIQNMKRLTAMNAGFRVIDIDESEPDYTFTVLEQQILPPSRKRRVLF